VTRFRLRPHVLEQDADGVWIGALPHGPIVHVGGVGELVLEVLGARVGADSEAAEPEATRPVLAAAQIAAHLHESIEGMPEDAEESIGEFLDQLALSDLVEGVPEEYR